MEKEKLGFNKAQKHTNTKIKALIVTFSRHIEKETKCKCKTGMSHFPHSCQREKRTRSQKNGALQNTKDRVTVSFTFSDSRLHLEEPLKKNRSCRSVTVFSFERQTSIHATPEMGPRSKLWL